MMMMMMMMMLMLMLMMMAMMTTINNIIVMFASPFPCPVLSLPVSRARARLLRWPHLCSRVLWSPPASGAPPQPVQRMPIPKDTQKEDEPSQGRQDEPRKRKTGTRTPSQGKQSKTN